MLLLFGLAFYIFSPWAAYMAGAVVTALKGVLKSEEVEEAQ